VLHIFVIRVLYCTVLSYFLLLAILGYFPESTSSEITSNRLCGILLLCPVHDGKLQPHRVNTVQGVGSGLLVVNALT